MIQITCVVFDKLFYVDYLARKLEELEAIMYETLHDYFDFCQQEGVLICCPLILLNSVFSCFQMVGFPLILDLYLG